MEDILTYIETLHKVKAYLTFVSSMKCGSAVQNLVNTQYTGEDWVYGYLIFDPVYPSPFKCWFAYKKKNFTKNLQIGKLPIWWTATYYMGSCSPWSHVNMVTQLFVQDFAVLDLNILDTFSMLALK